ncbi:MAG: nucleotidyltransferase domain-containing protein [Candidatus Woesearchaeota archaeon]
MGQMYKKRDKILELFYRNPNYQFTVREIAKETKVAKSTVQAYLKQLKKENLVSKENKAVPSEYFKLKKMNYYTEKIFEVGLIDFLKKKLNPSCIILFGSIRKGESMRDSDIDLFIESHNKSEISLSKFEKKLKHSIQLFTETNIKKLHSRLFNNVLNGIKLYGSFKIK